MENLNKIIKTNLVQLNNSNKTFEDIFEIIHSIEDNVFSELSDGYKVKKLTYKDIKNQSILMGRFFNNELKDIQKNDYVGIIMDNSPSWVSSFWGLLMAGYKPMLLNIRLGSKLNQEIIELLKIKCVIADKDYNLNCNMIYTNNIDLSNLNTEVEFNWANEIALSTSATTLNIKICVYTGQDIASQITNTDYIVKTNSMIKERYNGEIKIMAFLPFYHIFGLIATYFWFSFFGRTLVFLKDFSSETIIKTARKHKVTHIFAVPMVWNTIAKEIKKEISMKDEKTQKRFEKGLKISNKLQKNGSKLGFKLTNKIMTEVQEKIFGSSIKFLITGGGYISNSTIELLNGIGYPLYNGYGMSEIGITSVELRKGIRERISGSIGKPLPTVEYKIENEILYVKGKSICSKIISKQGETIIDHNEWFKTNDLAICDKKGNYYIIGRNDDVVVAQNGEKINPDLIEKEITLVNARRFCVLGLETEGKVDLSLVVEVPGEITILKTQKILEEIDEVIKKTEKNNCKIEKIFVTNDKIAADTAIKVSRSILIKKINTNEVTLKSLNEFKEENVFDENKINNEVYDEVLEMFSQVLHKEKDNISGNDHFIFDLGGTSLEYITLLINLKSKYEMDFNFGEGESCYTVYEIVNYILKKRD